MVVRRAWSVTSSGVGPPCLWGLLDDYAATGVVVITPLLVGSPVRSGRSMPGCYLGREEPGRHEQMSQPNN